MNGRKQPVLDDVTRDVVAIVAAILTLLAFAFAVGATVATMRQQKAASDAEARLLGRVEILEERVLDKLVGRK